MKKIKLGDKNYSFPSPMIIVGVTVKGKPNYLPVSYCAIANRVPSMFAISLNKLHYTCSGIKENGTFSINIPSVEMIAKADYCGLVSGKDIDKSTLFNAFYGTLKNAPLIQECPVNIECQVVHEIDLEGSNRLIIGKVVESYAEEKFLTKNLPDLQKINPLILSMAEFNYYNIGEPIGKAWNAGKCLLEPAAHSSVDPEVS
jgi:flavin reductase (DIM6/NTAB) family NADH-FMN oxidoreductase RutF